MNWRAILTSLLLCVRSGSVCFSGGGGGNQLLHSQSLYVCLCVLCPASRNSSKESRTGGQGKNIVIIIVVAFSTTEIVPDLEKSWKCVQPDVQCALFRLSEGGLLDQTQ